MDSGLGSNKLSLRLGVKPCSAIPGKAFGFHGSVVSMPNAA